MSKMKLVEDVKMGDMVRVEGVGQRVYAPDHQASDEGRDSRRVLAVYQNFVTVNLPLGGDTRFHIRNVVEIVECGEKNHDWNGMWNNTTNSRRCGRCLLAPAQKREACCIPGCVENNELGPHSWPHNHFHQPNRRKAERRKR